MAWVVSSEQGRLEERKFISVYLKSNKARHSAHSFIEFYFYEYHLIYLLNFLSWYKR